MRVLYCHNLVKTAFHECLCISSAAPCVEGVSPKMHKTWIDFFFDVPTNRHESQFRKSRSIPSHKRNYFTMVFPRPEQNRLCLTCKNFFAVSHFATEVDMNSHGCLTSSSSINGKSRKREPLASI